MSAPELNDDFRDLLACLRESAALTQISGVVWASRIEVVGAHPDRDDG